MIRLFSYVLRYDDGAAPNPFWGVCTLTICKPRIRKYADIGDWVIGTGSVNSHINDGYIYDLSKSLVYAMKISDIKSLKDYDLYCQKHLKNKIPKWFDKNWKKRMGDCIYDYSQGEKPEIRKGVHNENNRNTDLGGINALLSNEFYYFGEKAHPLPKNLHDIIKKSRGHLIVENESLVANFEDWISQFKKNHQYGDPQLMYKFNSKVSDELIAQCSTDHYNEDVDTDEEILC